MKGDRERCIEGGMDGYVSKPVRGAVLFQTIAEVLRQRLMALEQAGRWLQESLSEHPVSSLSTEELGRLAPLALSASERCGQVVTALDELLLGQATTAS